MSLKKAIVSIAAVAAASVLTYFVVKTLAKRQLEASQPKASDEEETSAEAEVANEAGTSEENLAAAETQAQRKWFAWVYSSDLKESVRSTWESDEYMTLADLKTLSATDVIYDPAWANGTGYLDYIIGVPVKSMKVDPNGASGNGGMIRFVDGSGRLAVGIQGTNGTVYAVVFQRYSPESSKDCLTSNAHHCIDTRGVQGRLTKRNFATLLKASANPKEQPEAYTGF